MRIPSPQRQRSRLIRKIDAVFSEYIKIRDGWICQRCDARHEPGSRGLHCSHYFHRADMGTRWDEDNCIALCFACHRLMEGAKQSLYMDFIRKRLTDGEYIRLEIKARAVTKFDMSDLRLLLAEWQRKLGELKNEKD